MADLLKPGGKLGVMRPVKLKEPTGANKPHIPHYSGLFHADTPGRQDNQNVAVPKNSYIVPADVTSGIGAGNSRAGAKILDHLTGQTSGGPSRGKAPSALNPASLPGGMTPFASGGRTDSNNDLVPIIVAGGEYHIHPLGVLHVSKTYGDGTMKSGHAILDSFVKHSRKKIISEMKALKGPKK